MPRYEVLVTTLPHPALLDPEGETIHQATQRLGFSAVYSVRAGRAFLLEIQADSPEAATEIARQLAEKLLHNPIVERFEVHTPKPALSLT